MGRRAAGGVMLTINFAFLTAHDPQLVQLGALAERYFRDDPGTAIFKLRQFAELLSKTVAARHALYLGERETFEDTLRRLAFERIIPKEASDVFHALRKAGNRAAHEAKGNHTDALSALKFARQLGIWFHRTYGKQADFKPGPFIPPPEPVDATAPLQEEIESLRRRVAESEDAASRAKREAEEHARARESVEQRLAREAEERAIWEKLAAESESKTGGDRRPSCRRCKLRPNKRPRRKALSLIQRGEEASTKIDLDEAATRALIDQQLRDSGWEADTKTLRHASGARPVKGRNLAIAEWPTASGPADYALFVGLTLVGVVEAKRRRKNVSAAIDQAERYSSGMGASDGFRLCRGRPVGQVTRCRSSSLRTAAPISSRLRPKAASGSATRADRRTTAVRWSVGRRRTVSQGSLRSTKMPPPRPSRKCHSSLAFRSATTSKQRSRRLKSALAAERRSMLLAMATGTGKTKLAIALLYRLLATKRFRRICFVVDRSALGDQAAGEFTTTKIVSGKAFADIFGLKELADVTPETETKVHICTIQGLVKRVLYAADSSEAPPVDQYDLMVIDECHRGYLLDREMSDAELSFRGQEDYISKYRRVLEYFDAVKIGLTATPALHTTEIFGDPIFTYSYRQAVIDGYLIDHEPPVRIETALARAGIVFEKDKQLDLLNTRTGEIDLAHAPDEIRFDVEQFNKQVVTTEFNRVVAEELANHIDPSAPDAGKTLIFAATDAHADIVVTEIKKAFAKKYGEIDDAAVKKITGSVDQGPDTHPLVPQRRQSEDCRHGRSSHHRH